MTSWKPPYIVSWTMGDHVYFWLMIDDLVNAWTSVTSSLGSAKSDRCGGLHWGSIHTQQWGATWISSPWLSSWNSFISWDFRKFEEYLEIFGGFNHQLLWQCESTNRCRVLQSGIQDHAIQGRSGRIRTPRWRPFNLRSEENWFFYTRVWLSWCHRWWLPTTNHNNSNDRGNRM